MSDTSKNLAIQMSFQPSTIKRLDHIAQMLNNSNKAQLISSSLSIAEIIISNIQEGSKIFINKKNGIRERLTLNGFPKQT